jgi:hypothetical protein
MSGGHRREHIMRFFRTAAVAALGLAVLSGPVLAADAPNAGKDITRQAFLDQAAKRFDAMDGNHDGTLTSAERKAAREKFRAEHPRHHRSGKSSAAPSTNP